MAIKKDLSEQRIFHDWTWSRIKHLCFWKGQIICRLFGHRVPKSADRPNCGRCEIALEEIYGLNFYNYYNPEPFRKVEDE